MHKGAVRRAKWARRRPNVAGQKSVAAKCVGFARARSGFAPLASRNGCVAARFALIYAYSSQSTHSRRSRRRPPRKAFRSTTTRAEAAPVSPPGPSRYPDFDPAGLAKPSKHRRRRDPRARHSGLSRPRRRRASAMGFSGSFGGFRRLRRAGDGVLHRPRSQRLRQPKYFCRMYSQYINNFLILFVTRLK